MALLHIYDSSDALIRQTAAKRAVKDHIAADGIDALTKGLTALVKAGSMFDKILFETHGNPGNIYFADDGVGASTLLGWLPLNYTRITTPEARVYFNGCNVAEGQEGWKFLYAAAKVFITPGGGQVFGQTSVGYGNPLNGHVVHLWGDTRTLFVDFSGQITESFEQ